MKIIIDAMGGDNAPLEIVKGALLAHGALGRGDACSPAGRRRPFCGPCEACGHEDAARRGWRSSDATETVEMCDDPATVFRQKKDTSMARGPDPAAGR